VLGDKRFLRTIKLRNLLSFGPEAPEIELLSLNVLIGPNGSGKSNLIEAISLLQSASGDLFLPVRTGGGLTEWLWKGSPQPRSAEINATLVNPHGSQALRHRLEFAVVAQRAELQDEAIENERPYVGKDDAYFYYRFQGGRPILNVKDGTFGHGGHRQLQREDLAPDQSVLSQRKDPDLYPEVTYLGSQYSRIRLFWEWNLGRNAPSRRPQQTDLAADFLQEDAANIALVLNDLEHRSNLRSRIVDRLKDADESVVDFSTKVLGGTIQVYLHFTAVQVNLEQYVFHSLTD
jgi:predicted ATPase